MRLLTLFTLETQFRNLFKEIVARVSTIYFKYKFLFIILKKEFYLGHQHELYDPMQVDGLVVAI